MILQTEIKIQPLEQTVSYGDGLLFLGSCFADEVGALCRGLGFNAMVNPFGVLYNPASIAQSVERLGSGSPFTHKEVISVGEGQYCTFSHNTAFWQSDEQMLLETVNNGLKEARERFLKAKWVVISLGTSWVFREIVWWSPIAISCLPDNLTGSFSLWNSQRIALPRCCKPIPTNNSFSLSRPCAI